MRTVIGIFAILLLTITTSCKAQQMVQVPNDAHKLQTNELQFIDRPLKNLLNEIKPEIKTADATRNYPDYFAFRFTDAEELKRKMIGRKLIGIYVYTKEPIDWDFNKRPKGKELMWTKEDVEKYGNLTVIRIKVIERIED